MNARATLPPAVVPGGECVFPAEELAARQGRLRELLHAKGIRHALHVWNDSKHDWPYWKPMASAYLP